MPQVSPAPEIRLRATCFDPISLSLLGERRKEKGERRKEKGERRKEKYWQILAAGNVFHKKAR
jgi:hypothetical protein